MKKSLLFLLLTAGILQAQESYTNVSGSFTWLMGNEITPIVSQDIIGASLTSQVSVGSDLTVDTKSDYQANYGVTMVTYRPGSSNAGCVESDMIEYRVKMREGITLTLTSITYDALKDGTDAAHYSWSYMVDGIESTPIEIRPAYVLRNNNANSNTAQLGHIEAITASAGREVAFRIYISHTANNKKLAFSNVTLHGEVNGTPTDTSNNYNVTLYAPDCGGYTPAIIGDFNNWSQGVTMTSGTDANGNTIYSTTIQALEGSSFKFRQAGIQDWSNEILIPNESGVLCNNPINHFTTETAILTDYSNGTYTLCSNIFIRYGTCGPNLNWSLQNGVLTISGTGDMINFSTKDYPLYSYRDSIASVIIRDSVTSIGANAFDGCSGITTITIGNSVTSIGANAFDGCSGLTSVTIPNSVTSIGDGAFSGCSTLQTIYLKSSTPSQLEYDVFRNTGMTNIYVPCGALNTYQNAEGWSSYASYIKNEHSIIQGVPLVEGTGSVNIPQTICEDTIEAIPAFGYHFVQWTDGNTDNPRVIDPVIEATYIAEFALNTSGTCGENLTWVMDTVTGILEISGTGNMNDYSYGTAPWLSFRESISSVIIGNSVTSIGGWAFFYCPGLTSITIPNSVTSIGDWAFGGCSGLTSIVWNAINCSDYCSNCNTPFYNDQVEGDHSNITSFVFGDSVQHIPAHLCKNLSNLTTITIGNSVTNIGAYAFDGCSELDTVYFESTTPPQLGAWAFKNTPSSLKIIVPCGTIDAYRRGDGDWYDYYSQIQSLPSAAIQTAPLVEGTGQVNVPQYICDTILKAIPAYGYHFVQWTDSVTDNPRIIDSEVEATYIAEFALDKYGRCGDDLLLHWSYDSDNHTLTISGNGSFNSNMYYGIEAPSEMTTLVIEDSVQSIGAYAFYAISSLTSVTLGQDVSRIRENAFYNCENLTVIHNYRSAPATVYSTTFDGVDKFACTLYVPEGSVAMYSAATGWRDFYSIVGFNPTGHENLSEDASAIRKVFEDGQLYILLPDGTRFDATGRKVE